MLRYCGDDRTGWCNGNVSAPLFTTQSKHFFSKLKKTSFEREFDLEDMDLETIVYSRTREQAAFALQILVVSKYSALVTLEALTAHVAFSF